MISFIEPLHSVLQSFASVNEYLELCALHFRTIINEGFFFQGPPGPPGPTGPSGKEGRRVRITSL